MTLSPYFAVGNLQRQLRAALRMRKATGWRHFGAWLRSNAIRSVPVSAGAIGMGCIGFGRHAVWEVTEACNLRCRHCHATSSSAGPNELTTEEGKRFLDQLAAMPEFRMLAFSGGEPLVRKDIDELLAHSTRRGLVNVIATNGTLIDDARARELRKLGVRGIAVGFDSTDPEIHNAIRRSPTAFDRALRGIQSCKAAGMVVQINYTAMRENLATLPDVIRFCHDIRADIMLCYQLVPMGRGSSIVASALTAEDNQQLVQTIRTLQRDAITIVEPVAAPQYWAHLLDRDDTTAKPEEPSDTFHGCAAGWGLMYVKPDGHVWPCPFIPISGGSVRDRTLSDIWQRSEIFLSLRDRSKLKGTCGSCENRNICGGCRGKAYATCGDPLAEDPCCYLHHRGLPAYQQEFTSGHEQPARLPVLDSPALQL
ncbi:MAG: radical SAM protein [Deltaproteobacteria bacterium]|nr:radical SAM protein [Deltaproteobacteria bacterium]